MPPLSMNALALPRVADAPPLLARTASNHAAISFAISTPLSQVYERWLEYVGFPRFMRGLEAEEADEGAWRLHLNGSSALWEAEVMERLPQARIAWESVSRRPAPNSGSVTFRASGESRTQVTIAVEFSLSRGVMPGTDPLAGLAMKLERELLKFAAFAKIEKR